VISRLDCRDIGGRAASGRPLAGFVDHTRKTPVDRPGSRRGLSLQLKALITNSEVAKHPFRNGSERSWMIVTYQHHGSRTPINSTWARIVGWPRSVKVRVELLMPPAVWSMGRGCGPGTAQGWKKP